MIPQKAGTEIDLNAKIDEDLQKAEEAQKDVQKQKPKLAQALASKWLKYIIIGATALGIGYKMFFAPTADEPKKKVKKQKAKSVKANQEAEQKKIASEKIAKSQAGQIVQKNKVSIGDQTISNSEALRQIQVPELKLPETPKIPTIEKITIIDEQKNTKSKTTETQKQNDKQEYEYVEVEVIENGEKIKKIVQKPINKEENKTSDKPTEQKTEPVVDEVKKKRKIRQKIRDRKGKVKTITTEVEMTDTEYQEYKEKLKSQTFDKVKTNSDTSEANLPDSSGSPLSQQNERDTPNNNGTIGDKKGKSKKERDIKNLGENALEEMFVLNGKGPNDKTSKQTSSSGKKDFILFDGASLAEKEVSTSNASNAVSKLSNLENTIATGKIMEAVLETAINSEAAGTIRAVMSKDVYGEAGSKILIPRGSRLYGSYTTTTSTVQTRLLLTWNKVIRPDGVVITMNADTYDQSGKKGIEGDIDTRYGELFKNSLLYSFVTLGTAIAVEKIAGIKNATSINTATGTTVTNTSPANAAAQSVIDTAQDIADKMTDGLTDDLNPVISIPQGMLLKVIANSDIVVSSAYKRRTQDIKLG